MNYKVVVDYINYEGKVERTFEKLFEEYLDASKYFVAVKESYENLGAYQIHSGYGFVFLKFDMSKKQELNCLSNMPELQINILLLDV